ncbi:ATP-grasp domain-containing protein [Oceanobacillus chungangensis]|uniref:Carbamoyl phosphate synthase-like protein n=1 Tax=Oceanobacillus chungangensis TaxID=1229152 RepID=A0A3D8Q0R4_9BACI|nr:ATP-grasp domain-containing protein [Oceanobacillus chungangensis]RDW21171.1 carbamoyl phosphate synthase-like protein [Oceanobacillus chungangensis]
MEQDIMLAKQSFIPVILGASIGVYSTARSFHEAYGVKSISVSRQLIGPIKHSAIIVPVLEPGMEDNDKLLACLNTVAQTYPDTPKLIIGSDDWHVEMVVDLRDKLEENWIVPYTDRESLHTVIDKAKFYDLCDELEIDYPKFIAFAGNHTLDSELPFSFPVVIKPTSRVAYENLKFAGKKKVFTAQNRQELDQIIDLIRNAGYLDELIVQEFIPGDDTAMHILTLYIAQDGEVKLASFGQTLLEDHTPGGIGNPLVIRTSRNDEAVEQATRLVKKVGYIGFANFDLKYDSRDGKYKFFELNPRLGRSNYYVTTGGHNPVEYYIKDYLENQPLSYTVAEKEMLYTILPKGLLLKYLKDKELRDRVKTLYKEKRVKNPMNYFSVEKNIKRLLYVLISTFNFYRKFKKYPPL